MLLPYAPYEGNDSLANAAVPQVVNYAEQALLGALLLDPHLVSDVPLEPGHFNNHTHGLLFGAMRVVPPPDPEEHRTGAAWLNAVFTEVRPQAPGLPHVYPHILVQACPQPPHVAAYVRIVHAAHARRTLRLHAERLARAATDSALPDLAAATGDHADALSLFLDTLSGQVTPHPGSIPRTPLLPDPPREADQDAVDEERLLLACASARPEEVTQMRWLVAADFVVPLHAALWQCLTGLVQRGEPVDAVTVLWQAQQSGVLSDDFTPHDLMALISGTAGSAEYWGTNIVHRSLLYRARAVAARIIAYTEDPATTPHQLITVSRRAMADLASVRTRWQRITAPPQPPTRADRASTPRAGPAPPSGSHRPAPRVTR